MTVSVMFPAKVSVDGTVEKVESYYLRQQVSVAAQGGLLPMYDPLRTLFDMSDPFYNLDSVNKVVYRGASLTCRQYADLYAQLAGIGVEMVISPRMYNKAHYVSGWYSAFKDLTPDAVFLPHADVATHRHALMPYLLDRVNFFDLYDNFAIRDTGATEKDGTTVILRQDVFEHIVDIASLQNGDTRGGVEITGVINNSTSTGVRVWWVDGEAVVTTDVFDSDLTVPDDFMDKVQSAVKSLGCSFVTTTLALRDDLSWEVVAVEDGQVSYFSAYPDENAFGDIFHALQNLD